MFGIWWTGLEFPRISPNWQFTEQPLNFDVMRLHARHSSKTTPQFQIENPDPNTGRPFANSGLPHKSHLKSVLKDWTLSMTGQPQRITDNATNCIASCTFEPKAKRNAQFTFPSFVSEFTDKTYQIALVRSITRRHRHPSSCACAGSACAWRTSSCPS